MKTDDFKNMPIKVKTLLMASAMVANTNVLDDQFFSSPEDRKSCIAELLKMSERLKQQAERAHTLHNLKERQKARKGSLTINGEKVW